MNRSLYRSWKFLYNFSPRAKTHLLPRFTAMRRVTSKEQEVLEINETQCLHSNLATDAYIAFRRRGDHIETIQ